MSIMYMFAVRPAKPLNDYSSTQPNIIQYANFLFVYSVNRRVLGTETLLVNWPISNIYHYL